MSKMSVSVSMARAPRRLPLGEHQRPDGKVRSGNRGGGMPAGNGRPAPMNV